MEMLLAKRNVQIRKLEIEKMELKKSKLDKFQGIFPSSLPGVGGGALRKVVIEGWQATPSIATFIRCNLKNLQELKTTKFPELKKYIIFDH